jgi:hypothetical protein
VKSFQRQAEKEEKLQREAANPRRKKTASTRIRETARNAFQEIEDAKRIRQGADVRLFEFPYLNFFAA